ncbi:MAG: hypothetical protein OEW29_11455 [Acidimicrobiia bacterium]|nr:hypothetical protein [Acidimicrobiia bacterium]MDH4363955.1 hypothetical protein [Acidimicrobiia bacterium]
MNSSKGELPARAVDRAILLVEADGDAVAARRGVRADPASTGHRRQIVFAAGNLTPVPVLHGPRAEALAVARWHLIPDHPRRPATLRRDEETAPDTRPAAECCRPSAAGCG